MLCLCYLCRFKPLRDHLRGFLIAAWAGDKIAEFSFPEISFHFPLRPWFFFVSPAYAGKSHSYLNSTFLNLGSPPRMRGKEQDQRHRRLHPGITPACAGKSPTAKQRGTLRRDHPRMCGEKFDVAHTCPLQVGSPPHVRGKAKSLAIKRLGQRITPACAGKRRLTVLDYLPLQDHPRMCGEKQKRSRPC